nr:transcription factor HES-7.1-like [Paramormyrops kingsleyae]
MQLLKPQVERHRRERINRSLESLKALLLREPWQQETICGQMEKAEVLKYFLRSSVDRETNGHFQNGFSACLQRASQFL